MSTTETLAAVVPVPHWRQGQPDADAQTVEHEDDGADWDSGMAWSETFRSALTDPYGQRFRPHLFGI
ncbi:hypothetical protein [Haloechinothrix salitolerans]|uniref:Uncharacterized protein n=1 Tax=Haloechinothrix salitolerans TaxID=926830 RepID=A0ABW2BZU3_9PSEU